MFTAPQILMSQRWMNGTFFRLAAETQAARAAEEGQSPTPADSSDLVLVLRQHPLTGERRFVIESRSVGPVP